MIVYTSRTRKAIARFKINHGKTLIKTNIDFANYNDLQDAESANQIAFNCLSTNY